MRAGPTGAASGRRPRPGWPPASRSCRLRGPAVGNAQPDGAEPDDQGGADAVEQGVSDPSENERREGHERSRGNVSHAVGDQAASAARDANPKLDGHG